MKLYARQVDDAKAKENAYKLAGGVGLYLKVVPSGFRYWRMKYRFNGKAKRMAFGAVPAVFLAQAKTSIRLSPGKKEKLICDVQLNNIFQAVALEWHGTKVKDDFA